ncbi:MAG: translation initiation factor IF-2 [Firmicutes bacterium]|nr:translation initiation factor IF-2 [Bacillota bacterium]MDY2919961.1 translation initiation factor IF-2 [Lentihominibacter sp.]
MKILDLAAELKLPADEVLEKAKSMGIHAAEISDEISNIDAASVRNTITRGSARQETKVARRSKARKSHEDKKDGEPKVTVRAANVKLPEIRKTTRAAAPARSESAPAAKAPTGKPVVSEEVANRKKPAGQPKPKVSKAMLEERIAREKEGQPEVKPERAVKSEPEVKKEPEVRKEPEPKKSLDRRPRTTLKVVKKAEDVRREEAEKKAAAKKAEEERKKKAAEREKKSVNSSDRQSRPSRRRDSEQVQNAQPEHSEKTSSRGKKKKDKDREQDKFSKLERGKKQGKAEPRSLEKQTRKKKHQNKPKVEEPAPEEMLPTGTTLINVPITVAGFAEQTKTSLSQIIMTLMKMGVIANQNQNLDEDMVQLLADEMGIQIAIGSVDEEETYQEEEGIETFEDKEEDLKPRPPIITVMGHVDHGKTSLLDAIRNTNVTAGESGGITQHIGASEVEINGQKIVFLDTPGHEAFTAMRARGAKTTDIAVLVVAADDSVKPQTVESISHAKAAGVPIIVAINKMDKPGANPDIVKKDLAEHGVLVEDWGGDVICVPVSAKTGDGIRNLLEMILLQAEVLELKANPNRLAMGTVLEARLDKAKGPVASILITNGTLKSDMSIVAGTCAGKIRLMSNQKGEKLKKAGPATAVEILGLSDVPQAGDVFNAVKKSSQAKEIAYNRQQKLRQEIMARNSSTTLEELFNQIQEGEVKELNLIVKADVQGSVGAIVTSLEKLNNDEVKVNIVHTGVGAINESDVMLAGTSGSIIIGFNVRPSITVSSMAERDGIQIRTYNVIYNIIDDIEAAMKGMLDPEYREVVLGTVEIRTTFKVPGVGVVGGAYVTDGKVVRNESVRLVRDGIVIHEGKISSLKRFKDDAREVAQGYECGIGIENYNDIKEGDIIECFTMEEIERV